MRAALYVRVSTFDQEPENQLQEPRRYALARAWTATEYVDRGVSGAKDRRPALDQLMADAKRRKIDVVICWKLDRFGRSLAHLINAIQTLTDAAVGFTAMNEGIDKSSATGRLMLGILGSFAQFERERIRERVSAGLARAKAQGKRLGRPKLAPPSARLGPVSHLSLTDAADALGVSRATIKRWRRAHKSVLLTA
jgi:putative DNA-invertase from lambdoid prophage Rac